MGSPEPMAERSPLFLGLARPPKFLWFVADKEPHFFEVLRISFGTVRPTKNRTHHGGDSFGA